MNDFSRTWMTVCLVSQPTGHGMHTMWRSKSCGHTPRSESMQARPTCGTGPVACRRGVTSWWCCSIRQHGSGEGPIPHARPGDQSVGVSFGSCGLRDCAIGDDRHETPSLVADNSQHQGCAVSLVVVVALRSSSCQFLFARCPAGLGGSVCQNPPCQFVAVHVHDLGDSGDPLRRDGHSHCNFSPCSWWNGTAKRREVAGGCLLGELGGHVAHDSRTTPAVAELIVGSLTVHAAVPELDGVGFVVPEWTSLADGLRPEPRTRTSRAGRAEGWMATELPVVWNATIVLRASCLTSAPRDGPCCDPRAVQLQEFLSQRLLHLV